MGLTGLFDLFRNNDDLRQFDIVIPLDVGGHVETANQFLYVGKDGQGKIIDIEQEKLDAATKAGGVNFVNLGNLTSTGLKAMGDALANEAFGLFIQNRGAGSLEDDLPKMGDYENPRAADLPALKQSLLDVAQDLGATAYDEDTQKLGPRGSQENQEQIASVVAMRAGAAEIEKVIGRITTMEKLPDYVADLEKDAQNHDDLSYHQKEAISDNLQDMGVKEAVQQPFLGNTQ